MDDRVLLLGRHRQGQPVVQGTQVGQRTLGDLGAALFELAVPPLQLAVASSRATTPST